MVLLLGFLQQNHKKQKESLKSMQEMTTGLIVNKLLQRLGKQLANSLQIVWIS